ncbi:hypothetical protein CAEBREN_07480 [Caenorhabditis brenneri]|uniref:Uncharacterized protein n=1 Tax=Caenorhabditis brenneri TaxID=135651 RepID=G0M6M4_CAEBE|nr:hypothetical protein CAEBREN_07480 [Caenorhabditis brenneri]
MLTFFIFFALILGTVESAPRWSTQKLIEVIERSCPPKNLLCPNPQYGLFDGYYWEWDYEAIRNSDMAQTFHQAPELDLPLLKSLKKEYCCRHGPCLIRCGIFPKKEIDLIEAFPRNAADLFSLNLPELEPYRGHVDKYIKLLKLVPEPIVPAEIEEFFDTVHKHRNLIRSRLNKNQL